MELGSISVFPQDDVFIAFSFMGDEYNRIMVLGFTIIGTLALLYGLKGARPVEQMVSVWALASAIGIVFANDFVTMFLFWELLTLTTASLIFIKNNAHAFAMAYRFLFFHLTGGLLFFVGIIQHYAATGSTVLEQPEAGLIFFVLGFGFKAGFIPFHLWIAWGYPSASLFSSVLLAGLTTKIGVYAVARILPAHDGIVLMGGSMALLGVCCALFQKNMRRLLSYHIVSQIGYMIAGVGLGASMAVDGGFFHLFNNIVYKSLLFMAAGVVLYSTGTENLHDLSHHDESEGDNCRDRPPVWRSLPLATLGAIVGALAIAGVPLFNGYISKYLLKESMAGAGPAEWMLLIASVGTTISFCKFVYFGFLKARSPVINRPHFTMQLSILAVSGMCIWLGVQPELMKTMLPYGSFLDFYSAGGIYKGLQPVIGGVLVFAVLARPLHKGIPLPSWLSIEYIMEPVLSKLARRIKTGFKKSLSIADRNRKNINIDQLLVGTMMIIILLIIFYFGVLGGF